MSEMIKQIIGFLMIASLFIGLFIYMAQDGEWRLAIKVFGITAGLLAWIFGAFYLMKG
jgi:hypothetical protein